MKVTDLSTPEYYHGRYKRGYPDGIPQDVFTIRIKNDAAGLQTIADLKASAKAAKSKSKVTFKVRGRHSNRKEMFKKTGRYHCAAADGNDFYLGSVEGPFAEYFSMYIYVFPASPKVTEALNLGRFVKVDAPK